MVAGLKAAPSTPVPIGRVVDHLAVRGVHHHHIGGLRQAANRIWFFASMASPAHVAAFAREIVVRGHLHRFGVHNGDVVLVFDIDIEVAFAIGDRLFRCATQVGYGAGDRSHLCASITVALGSAWLKTQTRSLNGIEHNAVGTALHINGLDTAEMLVSHIMTGLLLANP